MELIAPAHVDSPFRFAMPPPEKLPQPLLKLDEVAVGYGDVTVLKDIRINLFPGDRIGLLGPNGAGKSTFIKLLSGQLDAKGGEIVKAAIFVLAILPSTRLTSLTRLVTVGSPCPD